MKIVLRPIGILVLTIKKRVNSAERLDNRLGKVARLLPVRVDPMIRVRSCQASEGRFP